MAGCTLTGGKRRRKASMFRHTRALLKGVHSDYKRKRILPRTRRYLRAVTGDFNRYGNSLIKSASRMRRRTLGFR